MHDACSDAGGQTAKPEEAARRALQALADVMAAAGRVSLSDSIEVGELRLAVSVRRKRAKKGVEKCDDLPAAVAGQSKAARRVYRALRDARRVKGESEEVWQQDIYAAIVAADGEGAVSIRSVHRAVRLLCRLQVIRKEVARGYLLGGQQPPLPF